MEVEAKTGVETGSGVVLEELAREAYRLGSNDEMRSDLTYIHCLLLFSHEGVEF